MAHASNIGGPCLLGLHDCIVQFDGEQDQFVLLLFFFKGGFDFLFHPGTFNGMLREYQQQFVMDANRFVNTATDFVTYPHIMRCKPAAYIVVLQIVVQTLDKGFILTGIADKAGVVCDGMLCQRASIFDERIRQSCSAQEDFGNVSFRPQEGIGSNGRRKLVDDRFQLLNSAHVNSSKASISYSRFFEDSIAKVGMVEVGTDEVGMVEVGAAEVSTVEVDISEVSIAEVGAAEVGSAEVGAAVVDTAEVGMDEEARADDGTAENGIAEVSIAENGIAENGTVEIGTIEIGIAEVSTDEVGTVETGIAEVSTDEVGTVETGIAEVGTVETGIAEVSTDEVGIAEVKCISRMFRSPCIPVLDSLQETVYLFLICHYVLLLFWYGELIIEEYGHACKWGNLVLSSAASKAHCSKYIEFGLVLLVGF